MNSFACNSWDSCNKSKACQMVCRYIRKDPREILLVLLALAVATDVTEHVTWCMPRGPTQDSLTMTGGSGRGSYFIPKKPQLFSIPK